MLIASTLAFANDRRLSTAFRSNFLIIVDTLVTNKL